MLKFWLPILSAFGLVIKGWRTAVEKVTAWADRLLNNHMHHIEANTAETAEAMRDLKTYLESNVAIQQSILTNLEILKDRT